MSKTATGLSWMHSRAIQCKQAAYTPILIKVGNGHHVYVRARVAPPLILIKVGNDRHVNVRARPRPSRSAWAENIANAWLPIQTYGITSKGRNFNSKV